MDPADFKRYHQGPPRDLSHVKPQPNRLFIGHYVGDPESWFLAWGKTLEEAAIYVDCENAEPDMDSMREVAGPGFVEFRPKLEDSPVEDDDVPIVHLEPGRAMSLGDGEGVEDNDAWISEKIRDPLGLPNEPTPLKPLDVTQKRLSDAYRDLKRS